MIRYARIFVKIESSYEIKMRGINRKFNLKHRTV